MTATLFRQAVQLLALAVLPALVSGVIQLRWQGSGDEVPLATVQTWKDQVQWVDARPRASFDREHIPGAVLLNEDEWDKLVPAFLDAWEPEKHVVVYCDGGSCDASHAVAKRLREDLKIENVVVLQGGWASWQQK